jgi:putative sterol carrier protein
MTRFPSEEWATKFKDALNQNKNYEEVAKDWEGDFLFIITPDDNYPKETILYIDLWHGKCHQAKITDKNQKAAFTFKGPYSNWKKVINKELDPIRGLIRGMFILEGDSKVILDQTKAAQELVNTASCIKTEFEEKKHNDHNN